MEFGKALLLAKGYPLRLRLDLESVKRLALESGLGVGVGARLALESRMVTGAFRLAPALVLALESHRRLAMDLE